MDLCFLFCYNTRGPSSYLLRLGEDRCCWSGKRQAGWQTSGEASGSSGDAAVDWSLKMPIHSPLGARNWQIHHVSPASPQQVPFAAGCACHGGLAQSELIAVLGCMGEGGWLQGPVEVSSSELELTLDSQSWHEFTQGHVLLTDSRSLQPTVLTPATFPACVSPIGGHCSHLGALCSWSHLGINRLVGPGAA